tara:strand:- start:99 stop:428 length:330 start_codon:yes stop_codon:yes gene_type:complete
MPKELVEDIHEELFSNKFSTALTTLFIIMYGSLAYPKEKLPRIIKNVFKNQYFRLLILSFIMYQGNRDTTLSIFLAIGFTLIMNHLNRLELDKINKNNRAVVTTQARSR